MTSRSADGPLHDSFITKDEPPRPPSTEGPSSWKFWKAEAERWQQKFMAETRARSKQTSGIRFWCERILKKQAAPGEEDWMAGHKITAEEVLDLLDQPQEGGPA